MKGLTPKLALAIGSLAIAAVAARACFGPEERIAFLLYDDAYYYLGVAKHLADGDGSTFDGIEPTNGYHPLWLALLVPLAAIVRDPGAAARVAGALWYALAAALPWAVFWGFGKRMGAGAAAAAGLLVALAPWVGPASARPNGLETPLYLLAIAVALGAGARAIGTGRAPSAASALGVGALLGVAALARLDGALLAVAASLSIALGGRRAWGGTAALRAAALVAVASAAVVAPFLLWSQARFGSPMPMSGRVVALQAASERAALGGALSAGNLAHRAHVAAVEIPSLLGGQAVRGVPLLLALPALLLLGGAALRGIPGALGGARRPSDPVGVLATFAILHGAVYAFALWTAGEETYRVYYFAPQVLLVAVLAGAGVASWRLAPLGWLGLFALVGNLLVQSESYLRLLDAKPGRVADRFVYGWIRARLPEEAVLGAKDAGKLGWFSGRRVVNLDGLINDDRFLEALRTGREDRYVCASPIRYLFFDRPWVRGFDPARPERTSAAAEGLPSMLRRLATGDRCTLRDAGPATEDWVVLEVVR